MKALQWCLPVVGGRGAGLGNELVPWARAYLMSRVLGARLLSPAWALNARGYRRHFRTSRVDWLVQRLMTATLPCVRFDEAAYLANGAGAVEDAFARFVDQNGLRRRSPLVVTTDGLWGGIQHVARAREFVRSTLYQTRYAATNLAEVSARLNPEKLTVAMHVRLGDFAVADPKPETYRGRFNCALPLEWFVGIGKQLRRALGDDLEFLVFSDGTSDQLATLVKAIEPVDCQCSQPADVSDLLAMSQADLLISSISTYSVWAAALSKSQYIWFRPQLYEHPSGFLSIWGHEPGQQLPGSFTQQALAALRGDPCLPHSCRAYAVGLAETLPVDLILALQQRSRQLRQRSDLIRFGLVKNNLADQRNILR